MDQTKAIIKCTYSKQCTNTSEDKYFNDIEKICEDCQADKTFAEEDQKKEKAEKTFAEEENMLTASASHSDLSTKEDVNNNFYESTKVGDPQSSKITDFAALEKRKKETLERA